MKFALFFLATGVAGAATNHLSTRAENVVKTVLENPHLIPRSAYRVMAARAKLSKRSPQFLSFGSSQTGTAPKSTVPDVRELKPEGWPDAKRVKIRYGPYRIPPTSEKNVESMLLAINGMSNTFSIGVKKPCDGECAILSLVADLEYADGSPANTANGAWFHHAVLMNAGPSAKEPNCGGAIPVENIFMSGNEKTTGGFALPANETDIKSGYKITAADTFVLQTELMNMEDKEKWVWMTIDYEFLPGPHPDFMQGRTVWLSIGPMSMCGGRSANPFGASNLTITQQPKSKVFSESSIPWTAPRDGLILGMGGHLHDGGLTTEIYKNGELVCDSTAVYGKSSGSSTEPAGGHTHGNMRQRRQMGGMGGMGGSGPGEHILSQKTCRYKQGLPLKKGDKMYLTAKYDFNKHEGMQNNKGDSEGLMGIVGMLVATK